MNNHIIHMPRHVDYTYFESFHEQYSRALASDPLSQMTLDFSQVEYMDTASLGMLLDFHKKAKQHNVSAYIANAKPSVSKMLVLANIDRLFILI